MRLRGRLLSGFLVIAGITSPWLGQDFFGYFLFPR